MQLVHSFNYLLFSHSFPSHFAKSNQPAIYKGKVLKDYQTLAQLGFKSEDTIHAVVWQLEGAAQTQVKASGTEARGPARPSKGPAELPEISATPFTDFFREVGIVCTRDFGFV